MSEQEQKQNQEQVQGQEQVQDTSKNYIDAIEQLKANTVSKEMYDKVLKENKELLENLINNREVSTETPEPQNKIPLSQLRKELFTPEKELSDIEYVTKTLELRKRVLEETGEDCFVGISHGNAPSNEDYEKAQKCADVFEECIKEANGDNGKFIAILQSRTNDIFIPSNRK